MQLYIYRNNNQSGPHDEDVIKGQLRTGGLSPNDLGCRVGDNQWRQLGELFPDAVPQTPTSAPAVSSRAPVATAAAKKQPGGCRVALGITMLVIGLLMFVSGLGIAVAAPFVYNMPLCPIAEEDWTKVQDLKKKYDAAPPDSTDKTVAEDELKRAMSSYESSSGLCAEERGTRQLFIIGAAVVAGVGFILAIIGFFVRRVRQSPT